MRPTIHHRTVTADDATEVAYREAGPADGPGVLLLHGFPTAGYMFRDLIPHLADRFRVVAPDLPGFGATRTPAGYVHTFANLTATIDQFTARVGLARYAVYIFDYGAPVGLRLALAHPDRVTAIVSQNGNAYAEGLGELWKPVKAYWRDPTPAHRDALRALVSAEGIKAQYTDGSPDPTLIAPELYALDTFLVNRPGNVDVQLDLFADYQTNVALYPEFQRYLRDRRPPLLAIWGKNDPIFVPAGAEAFRRDLPGADVRLIDAGHFALATHVDVIGPAVHRFLSQHLL